MSRGETTPAKKRDRHLATWAFGVLVLTIIFVAAVRWRIADTPLERDEGEFAYGGQLIRQGEIPYTYLYNVKFPGTYVAYAVIMSLFGETTTGIHVGLLLVNIASIALVFAIGRKLCTDAAGAMAAVIFALITISPDALGFAAHASHFVMLCALAGVYFILRALEHERTTDAVWSGICMGVAFVCKQPGIAFGLLGLALLLGHRKRALALSYFVAWMAPFLAVCAILATAGKFNLFWRWTVQYASGHSKSLAEAPTMIKQTWNSLLPTTHVIAWAALGAVVLIVLQRQLPLRKRFLLAGFVIAGIAAVTPGFYFFSHYFIMLAAPVALCISVALFEGARVLKEKNSFRRMWWAPQMASVLWIGCALVSMRGYLFEAPPEMIIGYRYAGNPFLHARIIGDYIAKHTSAHAKIAVLHSEPEILFYAKRKSATGYIYAYDMTSGCRRRADMEKEFKQELLSAKPDYIVFVNTPYSWMIQDAHGSDLANWCWRYARTNCRLVGVADGVTHRLADTTFKWDDDAIHYKRREQSYIEVYCRNPEGPQLSAVGTTH